MPMFHRERLDLATRLLSSLAASAILVGCAASQRSPEPAAAKVEPPRHMACELENLPKMISTRRCPSGSSPALMSAEDLTGTALQIDPASGFVAVRAADLPGAHGGNWQHGTLDDFPEFAPAANDASARTPFVMWTGGHCIGEENLKDPAPHTRQGRAEDWLVIKFQIPSGAEGRYQLWLRTSHRLKDGDNDLWAGLVGQQDPIKRAGFGPAGQFRWSRGPSAELGAGVHAFYVAGRSACMGVEQLAVAREGVAVDALHADGATTR